MGHYLSDAQKKTFDQQGFLVVEGLLGEEDLRPLEAEYADLLDGRATALQAAGKITDTYTDLAFAERYERLLADYPPLTNYCNISLPLINGPIDPADFHMNAGPAVFGLLRNEKILDVVESVLGPEIAASPVQQMRMKPPTRRLDGESLTHSNVGPTTWHQDIVALLPEADDTDQVTIWAAITDADEENGCLVCMPESHRRGPMIHCANDALASEPHVPDSLTQGLKAVPLPVKRGGIVLFHKHNLHSSLPNRSARLRWSADLRYHRAGQPSGRPAFPGFIARSQADPRRELRDPAVWRTLWENARTAILAGAHGGVIFADDRWSDPAVC